MVLSFERLTMRQLRLKRPSAPKFAAAHRRPKRPPTSGQIRLWVGFIVAISVSLDAGADVLFEGYAKIMLGETHVGYTIQRYEFNPKSREFSTVYYLKTNKAGGDITESLKARATHSLKPISYQYTELVGTSARTIDARFKGETMTALVKKDGKQETMRKTLPKGAFLASFLGYLMLQGKEGIQTGVKYGYQAIAEEDGNLYAGEAYIQGEETVEGVKAFKVLNTYKGARFISFITHKGEVLGTVSPVQQITTTLVASIAQATGGIPLNSSNVKLLFGSVPKGEENVFARRALASAAMPPPVPPSLGPETRNTQQPPSDEAARKKENRLTATPTPGSADGGKGSDIPAGRGIIIKTRSDDLEPE